MAAKEGNVAEERNRFVRLEVADGRTWKERHGSFRFLPRFRELQNPAVISFERINFEIGKFAGQLHGGLDELLSGDVDGNVFGHIGKMSQKMTRLGTGATAKFHQPAPVSDQAGNFFYIIAKYLVFCARGIILLQFADFVEQPGTVLIVEKLAGEHFLRLREAGNYFG